MDDKAVYWRKFLVQLVNLDQITVIDYLVEICQLFAKLNFQIIIEVVSVFIA